MLSFYEFREMLKKEQAVTPMAGAPTTPVTPAANQPAAVLSSGATDALKKLEAETQNNPNVKKLIADLRNKMKSLNVQQITPV